LNLHPGVGDVIFAAHDMRDRHVGVIDDARECIEERAVATDEHRVGQ